MNDNPYQSPSADLRPDEPRPKNSTWWKVFFWISAVGMLVVIIGIPFLESVSGFDYVDIFLSVVGTVGLFGFAFYKRIGKIVYWRYFFYLVLFESIFYSLALPLVGYERYGELASINGWYAFEILYAAIYLSALYFYAYKRSFIWNDA